MVPYEPSPEATPSQSSHSPGPVQARPATARVMALQSCTQTFVPSYSSATTEDLEGKSQRKDKASEWEISVPEQSTHERLRELNITSEHQKLLASTTQWAPQAMTTAIHDPGRTKEMLIKGRDQNPENRGIMNVDRAIQPRRGQAG